MAASIYGLYDSQGNLRYVGKANDPAKRLKSHMRDARKRNTPLCAWLRKVGIPEMRILEAECDDWAEAERRHIAAGRAAGLKLLNLADGGDEPYCAPEVRAANGRKNARAIHDDPARRRLWELRKALGDALRRGYVSDFTKARMRAAAVKHPHLFSDWANVA